METTIHLAADPPLVFVRALGSCYRYLERGAVTYALYEIVDINDGLEVALVARVGAHFRRLGRWLHVSDTHSAAQAQRLVRLHHGDLLRLIEPRAEA